MNYRRRRYRCERCQSNVAESIDIALHCIHPRGRRNLFTISFRQNQSGVGSPLFGGFQAVGNLKTLLLKFTRLSLFYRVASLQRNSLRSDIINQKVLVELALLIASLKRNMSLTLSNLQFHLISSSLHHRHPFTKVHPKTPSFTNRTRKNLHLASPNVRFSNNFASVNGYSVHNSTKKEDYGDNNNVEFPERMRRLIDIIRSLLPGGSWWSFPEEVDVDVALIAKPVTVLRALQRMWQLIAVDRWIIYAAFSALIMSAVCHF